MKEIIIVTAFFDIGRKDFGSYARSAETYLQYFRFWAGIKNRMLIFCQPQYTESIRSVREEYGLADKTEITEIENIFDIEPRLFERMKRVENDRDFQNFRYYCAPENRADYSYAVMLKAWCMAQAAGHCSDDCMIAWVDFGINHSDYKYADSSEFRFLWEHEFPDKITAFCHFSPDTISLIDSLQFMVPCFDGSSVIMPQKLCGHYWEAVLDAMKTLVKVGCIDDDQMLSMIVYKNEPELFNIILEKGWYSVFELCCGRTFTLSPVPQADGSAASKSSQIVSKLAKMPQHPFIKRMYAKTIRYYYGQVKD